MRAARQSDVKFCWEMLLVAATWSLEPNDPAAAHERLAARGQSMVRRYLDGWQPAREPGVVALNKGGRPVGAAWVRRLAADRQTWGWLDAETPVLAMAVRQADRRQGVGRLLLASLRETLVAAGEYRLSLSVAEENEAAIALFSEAGFRTLATDDGACVMVMDLAAAPAALPESPAPEGL